MIVSYYDIKVVVGCVNNRRQGSLTQQFRDDREWAGQRTGSTTCEGPAYLATNPTRVTTRLDPRSAFQVGLRRSKCL
jgi:hypothetical protein